MEPLWTPWRMPYILGIKAAATCVFCEEVLAEGVEPDLVIHRGKTAFVILNLYPYATGHLMIVPYRHVGEITGLTADELEESTSLLQLAERAVEDEIGTRRQYVGINIGRCAGAGVEGHIHVHLVPGRPEGEPAAAIVPGQEVPEPLLLTRERLARAWARVSIPAGHSSNS